MDQSMVWLLLRVVQAFTMKSLYAVSDLHMDEAANREWLLQLPERRSDALIVAGDISDDLRRVEQCFAVLKSKYEEVFFCPGNHDLWVRDGTSLDKLKALQELAARCGVRTGPERFGGVLVVPMLSWHHASFDTEPAISKWRGIPSARKVMTDYRRCAWPDDLSDRDDSIAAYFDSLNENIERPDGPVVSFSHFLPRIELLPEKRYLYLPTLASAVGSTFLGRRVQALRPDVHCFGHTHFGWDATLDGVRYVQAALGYTQEWQCRPASLAIGDLAGDARHPVKIWDDAHGFVARYHARWSAYYDEYPRVPDLTHVLPPYTARLYRELPGAQVKDVLDHVPPFTVRTTTQRRAAAQSPSSS